MVLQNDIHLLNPPVDLEKNTILYVSFSPPPLLLLILLLRLSLSALNAEVIQGFVYLTLIYMNGFTTKQMVNPWKTYVKLSAILMGSHGLTEGSLALLNFPAQIMFKSTKIDVNSI